MGKRRPKSYYEWTDIQNAADRKAHAHVKNEKSLQKKVNKMSHLELVRAIFNGEEVLKYLYTAKMPQVWRRVLDISRLNKPHGLKGVFETVAEKSKTFFLSEENVKALGTIYDNRDRFVNEISDWKPAKRSASSQLPDLINFLFVKYDAPLFLHKYFYGGNSNDQILALELFFHIGEGQSVKKFPLLPEMRGLKKGYQYLTSTPEDYLLFQGFRRAQVLALGGSNDLAESISSSVLREERTVKNDSFWSTVIEYFAALPMFDNNQVPVVIDYLIEEKYTKRRNYVNGAWVTGDPRSPNLSMNGRNPNTLLAAAEAWHQELAREAVREQRARRNRNRGVFSTTYTQLSWKGYPIDNWNIQTGGKGNKTTHSVVQLNSSADLREEGASLGHCVGSYAYSCSTGRKSIFSYKVRVPGAKGSKSLITLEVIKNGSMYSIAQARGKGNRIPTNSEKEIIRRWASFNGIGSSRGI